MRAPPHRYVVAPFNLLDERLGGWEEKQLTANNSDELVFRCHASFVLRIDQQAPARPNVGLLMDKGMGSPALTKDVDHPAKLRERYLVHTPVLTQ
jgi:hypothetical protein